MKGIVRVPAWVKEAFKNGTTYLEIGKLGLNSLDLRSDGETVDDPETWPEGWIEQIEEPIEWERAKKNAEIEVSNDGVIWEPAHFSNKIGDMFRVFIDGKTSHTTKPHGAYSDYRFARFPQGVNPEDWYKD